MANDNSLRSYRDYDAYDRDAREAEPVVRGHGEGNPLADLARIMGQDETYADLLKTVARTRGDAAPQEPELADRHEDEHIDIPAMNLRAGLHADGVDWDDLEAELAHYRQTADGAEAEDLAHADELRDGHHDWDASGSRDDDLERQFAAEFERSYGDSRDATGSRDSSDPTGAYGAAVAAAAAGAAATWAMRSRQGAGGERGDHARSAGAETYPAADPSFLDDYAEEAPPRRRRGGVTAIAAVLGLAVLGGGGVYAYRSLNGTAGAGGEPRVVRADTSPVRVAVQQAQDAKPVTDRVPGGDRVVSREERPVSLREQAAQVQVPPTPARVIPLIPAPTAPAGVVTDPGQPPVRTVSTIPVAAGGGLPLAPQASRAPVQAAAPARVVEEPRWVRTVQVGPDGAPLSAPAPLMPAPAVSSQSPLSVVPATPAPAASAPPAALAAAESRAAPVPAPRPAPTLRVARAEPAAEPARPASRGATAPQPLDLGPQRTASVRGAASATGGTFVQISSHQTDAEARSAFSSAQRRFPMLQGQAPNIRIAEIPGRGTWHRLRVGPFSREEAQSFCQRLKTAGGSCVLN
ncbi:SPOR domain-containing protein [Phreatobacter sp. HK31-P]